jgi:hypothetical protein
MEAEIRRFLAGDVALAAAAFLAIGWTSKPHSLFERTFANRERGDATLWSRSCEKRWRT